MRHKAQKLSEVLKVQIFVVITVFEVSSRLNAENVVP